MGLVVTTLNGSIRLDQTKIRLTAFTNPATGPIGPKAIVVVDSEVMLVADALLSPTLQVVRGYNKTKASPHNTLAPVVYGLSTDMTQALGLASQPVQSYGVDGAITPPTVDSIVFLTKGSAGAYTLTGPAADQTNVVRIVSLTAFAHTVDYPAGFYQNTTTSNLARFPATAGGALTIQAKNGVWMPLATADDGVTIG